MSELVGVMLVDASFHVYAGAAGDSDRGTFVSVAAADNGNPIEWQATVGAGSENLVHARCRYLAELSVPIGQPPSPVTIDTAIAQAYDAFCLQYDLWRRASHIEWLRVLPMSLGVEPGQRSGTWTFAAAPAPKATTPTEGRKQKQHGKTRKDSPARKGSVGKRSKRG